MSQHAFQHEIFTETSDELQTLLDNVEQIANDDIRQRWPSTLQSLSELLHLELKRQGIDQPYLSDKLVISLSHYFGGRDIYIPTPNNLQVALRNIQIWRDFDGRNTEQLAIQHQLTERQITSILKEQRAAEFHRRQRALF